MKIGTTGMRKIGATRLAFAMGGLAAVLMACGDFSEKGDPATSPTPDAVTATKPDAPADLDPRSDAAADASPSIALPPATCGEAKALTPRATFNADKVAPMHPITPVDVYAYELGDASSRTLRIVLTEQADECAFRKSNLLPQSLNAMTYEIRREVKTGTPAPIGTGTYFTQKTANPDITVSFLQDWGKRCSTYNANDSSTPDDETVGVGDPVFGSITIEARSDTEIEGTITLNKSTGEETHVTFKAPICGMATPPSNPVCCGS